MKITKESHVDHALTAAQLEFITARFADRTAFVIETVELPENLGTVPCGLHGPLMGDVPLGPLLEQGDGGFLLGVPPSGREVWYAKRAPREYASRLCNRPSRPTRLVTVIAGPDDGEPCILYTAFGGPLAPQEPNDPMCKDVAESTEFWAEHALSDVY